MGNGTSGKSISASTKMSRLVTDSRSKAATAAFAREKATSQSFRDLRRRGLVEYVQVDVLPDRRPLSLRSRRLPARGEAQSKKSRLNNAIEVLRRIDVASRPLAKGAQLDSHILSTTPLKLDNSSYEVLRRYAIGHSNVGVKEEERGILGKALLKSGQTQTFLKVGSGSEDKVSVPLKANRGTVRLGRESAGMVVNAITSKVCICLLSDGTDTRSYPATKQACVAAATEYGLTWEWRCSQSGARKP